MDKFCWALAVQRTLLGTDTHARKQRLHPPLSRGMHRLLCCVCLQSAGGQCVGMLPIACTVPSEQCIELRL